MKHRITTFFLFFVITTCTLNAQSEHSLLLKGTNAYQKGDFETAETSFKEATTQNNSSVKGNFNLGNSLYKREKYDEAITYFENAASQTEDKSEKSQAFYNLGNTRLAQAKGGMQQQGQAPPSLTKDGQEQLEQAITAYKDALRNNPSDYDAKNNLNVAYQMLRQQEQQQENDQDKKDDNQDKNQDQDNKDDNQDKQDKNQEKPSDPQKPNENKPIDNDNQEVNSDAQELKKDEVDRLMEIIEQEDKKVQEKLINRKRTKTQTSDKEW